MSFRVFGVSLTCFSVGILFLHGISNRVTPQTLCMCLTKLIFSLEICASLVDVGVEECLMNAQQWTIFMWWKHVHEFSKFCRVLLSLKSTPYLDLFFFTLGAVPYLDRCMLFQILQKDGHTSIWLFYSWKLLSAWSFGIMHETIHAV